MATPSNAAPTPPRSWDRLHIWQIQSVRDVLVIAAAIGLIWLGYAMRSVTTPLLVALALAYLFEPMIEWITRRYKLSRTVVVSSLLLTLLCAVTLALTLTIPLVLRQTSSLISDMRSGKLIRAVERVELSLPTSLRDPWHALMESVGIRSAGSEDSPATARPDGTAPAETNESIAKDGATSPKPLVEPGSGEALPSSAVQGVQGIARTDRPARSISDDEHIREIVRDELDRQVIAQPTTDTARYVTLLRRGMETASSIVGMLVTVGLLTFLIPFYFFFFSVSYPTVQQFAQNLIPDTHRNQSLELLGQMDNAVAGFVRGRLVISVIVGTVMAIGWLICGVPYSIVLGIIVGVFNLVPYLSGIGLPIAVGLLAFEQLALGPESRMSWIWILLGPSIVFLIAQLLDGYVLTPLIAGRATNLDPVTILVAVLAGGSIGGVYGMLLAIPVMACLKILVREVVFPKVKKWTRGEAADPLPLRE